jgi:hypothetical protein
MISRLLTHFKLMYRGPRCWWRKRCQGADSGNLFSLWTPHPTSTLKGSTNEKFRSLCADACHVTTTEGLFRRKATVSPHTEVISYRVVEEPAGTNHLTNCMGHSSPCEANETLLTWNQGIHCIVHNSPSLVPTWARWIQFTPFYSVSLRSILILFSCLPIRLPSGLFLSGLLT